jgi:predicted kinase
MQELLCKPWLVLCWGAPAAGKSTLAQRLAQKLGAPRLSSDAVNHALIGDRFEPQLRPAIYQGLLAMAASLLQNGGKVVLDGTYLHRSARQEIEQLAQQLGVVWLSVQVDCAFSIRVERNAQRPDAQRVPESWLCSAHSRAQLGRREAHCYLDTGTTPLEVCLEKAEQALLSRLRRRHGMWLRTG